MVSDNLKSVTLSIAKSCEKSGRKPEDVKLVCVTKEAALSDIEEILASGVRDIGENRVQEALLKYNTIGDKAAWHLIGHLQTNKARDAVKIFSLIHSVDSVRLAKEIDKEAKKIGKIQNILAEVNISGEASKFGMKPEELKPFFKEIALYPNINILGLMTVAPEAEDPEKVRPYFRGLRELLNELNSMLNTKYSILSMGMSNDFEIAIEEGATIVRVGRAIFGSKHDK